MEKQVIITIGRESGSGGLEIAQKLSERLGITLYEKNIFEALGEHFDIDTTELKRFDEAPRFKGFTRKVNGYSNSAAEQVVELQRAFIKAKADEGKSFVIIGRCGIKAVLDHPCTLIRIFVEADKDFKIQRTKAEQGFKDDRQALKFMNWVDIRRRSYHDQFCDGVKWGERSSYDIIVKSNKLGIDRTVDWLESYVRMRLENE